MIFFQKKKPNFSATWLVDEPSVAMATRDRSRPRRRWRHDVGTSSFHDLDATLWPGRAVFDWILLANRRTVKAPPPDAAGRRRLRLADSVVVVFCFSFFFFFFFFSSFCAVSLPFDWTFLRCRRAESIRSHFRDRSKGADKRRHAIGGREKGKKNCKATVDLDGPWYCFSYFFIIDHWMDSLIILIKSLPYLESGHRRSSNEFHLKSIW